MTPRGSAGLTNNWISRPNFSHPFRRTRVDLLPYESNTTDKREQYDWRAEKNLNGILIFVHFAHPFYLGSLDSHILVLVFFLSFYPSPRTEYFVAKNALRGRPFQKWVEFQTNFKCLSVCLSWREGAVFMDEINCEIASASAAWGAGEAGWMRVTFLFLFLEHHPSPYWYVVCVTEECKRLSIRSRFVPPSVRREVKGFRRGFERITCPDFFSVILSY